MKKRMRLLFLSILLFSAGNSFAQFDTYFYNKTLRLDYSHCGDNKQDEIFFEGLREEPYWGGSKTNLIDTTLYGNYYLNVYDLKTNKLIYSRGYCSLFGEWRMTDEALTTRRSCPEAVTMPFPKENVRIEREKTMKDLQTQIAGLAMASAEKIVGDKEQNIYDQFLGEVGGTDEDTDK